MMKYRIVLGIMAFLLGACSFEDRLKSSDGVYVAVMESVDTVTVLPGGEISFKFIASTNGGALERAQIVDKTFEFADSSQNVEFRMVDTTLHLSMDADGYFSRPVSTVMLMYPFYIPKKFDLVGKQLGMTLKVTNTAGKSGSVSSFFKVHNMKIEEGSAYRYVYDTSGYACANHRVYRGLVECSKNQKTVDMVAWKDPDTGKWYYLSPSAPEIVALMQEKGLKWDLDSIKTTRFVKLPDMDQKAFNLVDEKALNAIDFSEAMDRVELNEQAESVAYLTSDDRRNLMQTNVVTYYDQPLISGSSKHTYMTLEDQIKLEEEEAKREEEANKNKEDKEEK